MVYLSNITYVIFNLNIYHVHMEFRYETFDFESDKILQMLSDEERKRVLAAAKSITFPKGKLLFYEKGLPTGVFIIVRGKVKIFKASIDGRDQIFYIYKENDMLGYHALLCKEPYEDSCETLEETTTLFIKADTFFKLLQEIPLLSQLLIQNMSHEFGVLVNIITILAQKPLAERLALFLLLLERTYASEGISLDRESLANMIGTSRESLGRILKVFKDDKLIRVSGRSIYILKRDRLVKYAMLK